MLLSLSIATAAITAVGEVKTTSNHFIFWTFVNIIVFVVVFGAVLKKKVFACQNWLAGKRIYLGCDASKGAFAAETGYVF